MYPNPQDALPLPPRPNLEQYKKQAKDLVRACRSGEPDAVRLWAARWIESLAALHAGAGNPPAREPIDRDAGDVAQFARTKLSSANGQPPKCSLADAQFVIARAHGFSSWPRLVTHLESLARSSSQISAFEAAADAIVAGDAATLERLLRDNPALIRARSTREHHATLLHYVSANGVEGYRQKSPKNAARLAAILLDAGADVDAAANVYRGKCTALALVATSMPPAIAGVQQDVIDVLLRHGARMDLPGMGGNGHALIRACLANGQPEAAEYLASRGAPLDLPGAAGLGRVDALTRFFDEDGRLNATATHAEMMDGFSLACAYGRADAVGFLLERGVDTDAELNGHGEGHTGLHVAAFHGHADVVKALLRRGARVDVIDNTWGTPPLAWALTGWSREPASEAPRYYDVVALLVAAGAAVKPDWLTWENVRADPKMLAALTPSNITRT